MRKDFRDFINIINSVVFEKEIECSGMDTEKMSALAESHNMSAVLSAFTAEKFGTDSDAFKKCERRNDLLSYKYLAQCSEYRSLCRYMKENGIRYIPFKGIILKDLYPSPELREMADIDILVDKENLEPIKKRLTECGYSYEHKGHHDVYKKSPGICFEIHETLIDKQRSTGFDEYFENPWERSEAQKDEIEYRLTPENEYIYLAAHLYGHFHQGGVGIRAVLDIYLLRKQRNLDFDYIYKIFRQNGIFDFCKNLEKLSKCWFENEPGGSICEELGEYIVTSGTYGKIERMNLDLSCGNSSKSHNISAVLKRKLFLGKNELNRRYPWSKNAVLLPAAYAVRIFDVLFNHGKEAGGWISAFRSADEAKIKKHKELMKRFGINN